MNLFLIMTIIIIILLLTILITHNKTTKLDFNETYKSKNSKILISYSYFERHNTLKNLDFFLTHGLKDNINIIINVKGRKLSLDIDNYKYSKNIRIIKTENKGFDFGAHKENLEYFYNHILEWDTNNTRNRGIRTFLNNTSYNYIVLMNDSSIGPFVKKGNWYTPFINKNTNIVGTIRLGGYFLFIDKKNIYKIYQIIMNNSTKNYKDVVKIEHIIRNLKTVTKSNLSKIKQWNKPHSPFGVIFVKENRIGKNLSINKSASKGVSSYITRKTLNNAIKYMDNNYYSI